MDILLLAAGKGTRLKEATQKIPKCLVSIAGKPLIDLILNQLHKLTAHQKIWIVGGYGFEELQKHLSSFSSLKLLENKDYQKGSILTLATVLPYLKDSLMLLNTDHIFSDVIMNKVLEKVRSFPNSHSFIHIVTDTDRTLIEDDMKVKKKQDGSLETMSKTLDHYEEGYIGISLIPKTKLPIYKACIEKLIQTDQTHLHVEAVLNQLVSEGEIIHSLNVSGSWWLEVDTPQDKEKAEKFFTKLP
ncbi:MAG: hypothetical protein A3G32_08195 [Deltaproteobacteria bacterium RIFCSPLOWO2_12_FULL_40_28]|nr:MAG: hypothetical protein A3C45_00895 [Deltaproteobacteria bacterium RIFCSPHIGHO2_02_FULL_40_28]OGQ20890.1 MAG: hypothetical protein A3E27_03560 [Deltaproteobacteria bacterium RIFCSPHIGHO2_12_FULL_40_32]OGQ39291.1 MAG: hypothetical protein A3I69_04920 [Deltaproteobacteria bacterium RIFCSPLOWO2_02_FULL_40_36]OGQ54572.1 MAG: hypothetical protein A3G32_08195 [Deltaproteobacteria bacterium RIFCSPLOWO2_12_FULL_40_28]